MSREISERLKNIVNSIGWTQEKLAKEIHSSRQTINRWVTGKVPPTRNSLLRVANVTGCSLEWLLTGQGEMFPAPGPETRYETWEEQVEAENEWAEQLEMEEEIAREEEVAKLLAKASVVLKFKFKHNTRCYSDSLAASINALYRAVQLEEKFVPKKGLLALLERGEKKRAENK